MKLQQLQSLMQDIKPFETPRLDLEQYPTGVEIAARMLYTIASVYEDFDGCTVLDVGCGTGRLTIGAALLGSRHVIGVDIDEAALDTCQENLNDFDDLPVDLVQCNVTDLESQCRLKVDTVVMNPPFGTRRKGADIEFLKAGLKIARRSVYSLHKTSTRSHIQKLVANELKGGKSQVIAQLRYDLPKSFVFHKQKSKDIEVDLWRFEVEPTESR